MRSVVLVLWLVARTAAAGPAGEQERIHAHLTHALAALRGAQPAALTPEQAALRSESLAELARYIDRGEFPRRTDDAYRGLRPRFIDDRGVHCAVADLISASGHEDLAREIAATYEYAYVPEMHSPALAAWAASHGFTVEELAMIQPTYHDPPPMPERTRNILLARADELVLGCASAGAPQSRISLHVHGGKRSIEVTTKARDAFSACVADRASARATAVDIEPFDLDMDLRLLSPQQILERKLAGFQFPDCLPRPGDLPVDATLTVDTSAEQPVTVVTSPRNSEVERCLEAEVAPQFRTVLPVAGLHVTFTGKLMPHVVRAWGGEKARYALHEALADCGVTTAAFDATITAARGATALAIKTTSKRYDACIRAHTEARLVHDLSVERDVDGVREPYFRVDAPIDWHLHASCKAKNCGVDPLVAR